MRPWADHQVQLQAAVVGLNQPLDRRYARLLPGASARARMNTEYKKIRPAALSSQILSLTGRLETLATAKQPAPVKPPVNED